MPPRLRKLVGFAFFLPALAAYFFAAAALADLVPKHWLLQAVYFLVAGIAWAFPAKFLFTWMNAEPKSREKSRNN
jgi:hypothetical protein